MRELAAVRQRQARISRTPGRRDIAERGAQRAVLTLIRKRVALLQPHLKLSPA